MDARFSVFQYVPNFKNMALLWEQTMTSLYKPEDQAVETESPGWGPTEETHPMKDEVVL